MLTPRRAILVALLAGALAATFIMVLYQTSGSRQAGGDISLTDAIIGVIGVAFTGLVTLAGVMLKYSIDKRSAQQSRDAERRLKLEAAIRAIQLLSTQTGGEALPIQRAGALFMLSSLGQHDLTMALTERLMGDRAIDAKTVARLADNALTGEDISAKYDAIDMIRDNASYLLTRAVLLIPMR